MTIIKALGDRKAIALCLSPAVLHPTPGVGYIPFITGISELWLIFFYLQKNLDCDLSLDLCFEIQWNFNGSNTDGSFTTAVSNSFLSPLEQVP